MSDSETGTEAEEARSERFAAFFGVSEQQLQASGIDPVQYARDNIHRTLQQPGKAEMLLPRSSILLNHYNKRMIRGWNLLYAALAFLVLSVPNPTHWVGIAGAITMAAINVFTQATAHSIRTQYKVACKVEGIQPTWRRTR